MGVCENGEEMEGTGCSIHLSRNIHINLVQTKWLVKTGAYKHCEAALLYSA